MGQDVTLAESQIKNCKGCRWADGRVAGTGLPCCQKLSLPRVKDGVCLDREAGGGRQVRNRRLRGIIQEAEQKAQDPTRRVAARSAYLELEISARRVLAEELIDEANRRRLEKVSSRIAGVE